MTKYRAVRTEVDGVVFASKKEAACYWNLKALERSGIITELVLQPKYPLFVNGVKVCTYIADFKFLDKGRVVRIYDVKGVKTPVYRLKFKLFHALNPTLRITEV